MHMFVPEVHLCSVIYWPEGVRLDVEPLPCLAQTALPQEDPCMLLQIESRIQGQLKFHYQIIR